MASERILITGASGFIGSHLARRLLVEGYEVFVLLRASARTERIADILPQLRVLRGDILDIPSLEAAFAAVRPTGVVHLATSIVYSGVAPSDEDLIDVNLWGTYNLIRAAAPYDYRCFISTGSSSEYGLKDHPCREDEACEPLTVHGLSKLAATLYGQQEARRQAKPVVGVRLFSPYGLGDDARRFISLAIGRCLAGEPLQLSSPNIARDYIYVDDVVNFYVECLARGHEHAGEIFNVGSGQQSTLGEVAQLVVELTGSASDLRWGSFPPAAYDSTHWCADMTKTFRSFSWRPKVSLREGVQRTVESIRAARL